jgi:hypothetical protein
VVRQPEPLSTRPRFWRCFSRRRLTPERARRLVTDFEHGMIRELAIDLRHAVDLAASWRRIV